MTAPHERLTRRWTEQGIRLAPGAPLERIERVEHELGLNMPADFKEYFLHVDGSWGHVEIDDPLGFSFWPLAQLKTVEAIVEEHRLEGQLHVEGYVVFADYLQWCWAYAICLDPANADYGQIAHVGTLRPKTVARDFASFVDCYLSDCQDLYQVHTV